MINILFTGMRHNGFEGSKTDNVFYCFLTPDKNKKSFQNRRVWRVFNMPLLSDTIDQWGM